MTPLKDIRDALDDDHEFLVSHAEAGERMDDSSPSPRSPPSRPHSSSSKSSSSTSMTSNASRPRAFLSSRKPKNHESRRLFDPDDGDVVEDAEPYEEFDLSPPRALQRPMLRPLNLNNESQSFEVMDAGEDCVSAMPTPFPTCRKRPASDARVESSKEAAEFAFHGSTGMHLSPHISPNSFLTMDGRFVQSKNPFSSPMLTDDDTAVTGTLASHPSASATVPTLPVTFQAEVSGFGAMSCTLAPRNHHHRASQRRPPVQAITSMAGGFPDKFCFTGSPIQEDEVMEESSSTAASSASLAKVRRFNVTDDIVAASGQEISTYKKNLSIDTKAPVAPSAMGYDPSPTDVLSFPTPPTPVKAKPHFKAHENYYSMIRRQDPATPSLERGVLPPGVLDAKTPHPGRSSLLPRETDHISQFSFANSSSRFTNDFDVIGELGKGSFGCVYKVLSRLDGCMYAIKAAKRQAKGSADRDRMLKEVYALAALSDQADTATFHIVRYHQAWMEDDRLYIQTELCSGTLAEEMAFGPLAESRRLKLLREMLLALDYIHARGMIHLDIKPANIFVKNDQYKLGDFGLVTCASSHQDVEEGDSRYMSMELLSGDCTDLTKSDIFSLGATLYELCLHRPLPMNGPEWQSIRGGRLVMPMPNTSTELCEIVSQMMHRDASSRPSAGQLLRHPQLLSDEQKALNAEKSRVMALQLAQVQQRFPPATVPPRRGLMRSNTWNGSSIHSYF